MRELGEGLLALLTVLFYLPLGMMMLWYIWNAWDECSWMIHRAVIVVGAYVMSFGNATVKHVPEGAQPYDRKSGSIGSDAPAKLIAFDGSCKPVSACRCGSDQNRENFQGLGTSENRPPACYTGAEIVIDSCEGLDTWEGEGGR